MPVPAAGYEAVTVYVPTSAPPTVQVVGEVVCDVFVPTMVLKGEFVGHVGEFGLCENAHWILPVGGGVVLLGGTTLAMKVRVSPNVGVGEDEVAVTRTVVVAGPRATKLSDPPDPSGAWPTTVISCEPLSGQLPEVLTQLELCASHCCTVLTEIE